MCSKAEWKAKPFAPPASTRSCCTPSFHTTFNIRTPYSTPEHAGNKISDTSSGAINCAAHLRRGAIYPTYSNPVKLKTRKGIIFDTVDREYYAVSNIQYRSYRDLRMSCRASWYNERQAYERIDTLKSH